MTVLGHSSFVEVVDLYLRSSRSSKARSVISPLSGRVTGDSGVEGPLEGPLKGPDQLQASWAIGKAKSVEQFRR